MKTNSASTAQSVKMTDVMIQGEFTEWNRVYRLDLQRYCCMLTGSKWDGEDLAQETWVKVWQSLQSRNGKLKITRAYLYRIARNAWIDRSRKRRITHDSTLTDELAEYKIDQIEVWAAMETLVERLGPYQRSVLLLVDILQYTAIEAANLLQTTEGAVKAALHRARMKMKSSRDTSQIHGDLRRSDRSEDHLIISNNKAESDDVLVYNYMVAIQQQNTPALLMLLDNSTSSDLLPIMTFLSYQRSSMEVGVSEDIISRNRSSNHVVSLAA